MCVLSDKGFTHEDFMMEALPIGGFRMLDGNEADDWIYEK
jgi:inorganic pyrophosphatase